VKWTNPGHQLDELGVRYLKIKKLYLYGMDETAEKTYNFLKWLKVDKDIAITFVVDITIYNRMDSHEFCGKRVIAFQTDVCDEVRDALEESVVALPSAAQTAETEILHQLGYYNIFYLNGNSNRRDNFIQNFVCVWVMYKHGKLLSHYTNFLTTLRCNLNCVGCLNFNNNLKDPQDVSFEDFKEHFDAVFTKFDFLYSLHFTGGEPCLVKELPRFIRYLEENYKERIFDFFVITNSTIVPSEEVISAVKALDGYFFLDDYSASVPNTKIEEIKSTLDSRKARYVINKPTFWYDLNVGNNFNELTEGELEEYKDDCNSFLHEFEGKRIYACCYQRYANKAGFGELTDNDYIEITETTKMEILEFRQGYTRKGFLELCKHCRGIVGNAKRITPAIQMPKVPRIRYQTVVDHPAENVKVSICVPVYNTVKYLARCVNSLLGQTYQNIEVILADDGSADGCSELCDEYAKFDTRVKVIHKENGGEASARNAALLAATGEYVMFIDSDDEYLHNAVELLINASKQEAGDLVIGGYLEKNDETVHFGTGHLQKYSVMEAARSYLESNGNYGDSYIFSSVNAKLFRRSILFANHVLFDERFVIGNDSIFICDYLRNAKNIYNVCAPVYVYYKFHPAERVQGMAWFYPDAFFLFAYMADKMIKFAQYGENEQNQMIVKHYKDLLYGLTNATVNETYFKDGLLPYLTSFCDEIDLLRTGAHLDLFENCIKKENGDIPHKLMSYLIVSERFGELYDLLGAVSKTRGMVPADAEHIRPMIKDTGNKIKDDRKTTANYNFANDSLLMEQLDNMIRSITTGQQKIGAYEQKTSAYEAELNNAKSVINVYETELNNAKSVIGAYEAELNGTKSAIDAYEHSTSWRITKPFRAVARRLRK
jgi:glycosyltransferase involved in cell wall biosynthesis/organic radical activating enzyme